MVRSVRYLLALGLTCAAATALLSCRGGSSSSHRSFPTPEAAVRALIGAVERGQVPELLAIFGPDAQELIGSSDPATARRHRQVFRAAAAERWQLVDHSANERLLVIGNEDWPFPVPLVKSDQRWRFDTAAGKEEVVARRIGRNELSAIRACRIYVFAQRQYARERHDGKRAGLYATTFRSDPGKQNGLYWPAARGVKRSPLGDLLAEAAEGRQLRRPEDRPAPFHGYYFRILTAQGPAAAGGAKNYLVAGELSGGFALVAWPAEYDVTGVMTFSVNHDGIVRQKDLGATTGDVARAMSRYDPDASWAPAR